MQRVCVVLITGLIIAASTGCAGRRTLSSNPSYNPAAPAFGSGGGGRTAERSMVVRATAYNSTPAQTDGRPREAAWGDRLSPGVPAIAVSPDLVRAGLGPGTPVRIEGFSGRFVVLDKTSSRHRRHIDIYMGQNTALARKFGKKTVRIFWPGTNSGSPVRR